MKHAAAILLMLTAAPAMAGDACVTTPVPIPDFDPAGVTVPIEVSAGAGEIISAIEIDLEITHPWVGDLVVTLESPTGAIVTLLDRPGIPSDGFPGPFGCGGRDIAATFTDTAATPAEDICAYAPQPVLTGSVLPSDPLSLFAGQPAAGTWLLHLADIPSYDVGQLDSACLRITTAPACPADISGDGLLNFFDLSQFLAAFSAGDLTADFNKDGIVDFFDISAFLGAFVAGCP